MKKYRVFLLFLAPFILGQFLLFSDITYSQTLPDYTADRVIGQSDFVTCTPGTSQTTLNYPHGISLDTTTSPPILYIVDPSNRRILGYYNYPFLQNGAAADFVIGQTDFVSATSGTTSTKFSKPEYAVPYEGNLWVTDFANNRVLVFILPITTDFTADYVFGQGGSFTSADLNKGGLSDSSLYYPSNIAFDNQNRVYITDTGNNRILIFNDPLNTDFKADYVIGQPDFTSNSSSCTDSTLNYPVGCRVSENGDLFVVDANNNRVLKFIDPINDKKADQVFGQGGSFITGTVNNPTLSEVSLAGPRNVFIDKSGYLYISDNSNNRILVFTTPLDTAADYVYGQNGSFTDSTSGTSPDSLWSCRDMLVDNTGNLLILEELNHRVLKFFKSNASDIYLSKESLPFGGVPLDSTRTDSIIIRNAGLSDLTVSDITVPFGFKLMTNTSFTLAYGDTEVVKIEFTPSQKRTYSGNVVISSNDADEPTINVPISGSGVFLGNWSSQTSGTVENFTGVHFINSDIGWAVGYNGTILHTTDGGENWSSQTSGTASTLMGVHFVNSNTGWAVGNGGTIRYTSDGGTTWSGQTSNTAEDLQRISFISPDTGWVNALTVILHTTNGGTDWSSQSAGTAAGLWDVSFADSDNGWAVGNTGTIIHTSDGGTTWSGQISGTTENIRGVYFANPDTGWAVGDDATILYTANGGTNWSYQNSGASISIWFLEVNFIDSNNGWTVGTGGYIFHTNNGGASWNARTSGTTEGLEAVYFTDINTGWAAGYNGTILKYTATDVTVSIPDSAAAPGDTLDMPIKISDIDSTNKILNFEFKIAIDTAKLEILSYNVTGFLADGFSIESNFAYDDTFIISGASADPCSLSGTLMELKCVVDSSFAFGDSIFIKFANLMINEWDKKSGKTEDGLIYFPNYYGDVSLDGGITTSDATLILKYRVNLITLDAAALAAADVSSSGEITAYDAGLILQYIAYIITSFPAGEMFTFPKDAFKNSIASLIIDTEDEEYIYYSLHLNNIKDVYSSTITIELSGSENVSVNKTETLKNYLMEHNVHNGLLHIALAGCEPLNDDVKIINLKFKKVSKDGKLNLSRVLVNEVEINIEEGSAALPKECGLSQNYPNPFNPETTIKYQLPEKCNVEIYVYNILGQKVKTLADKNINAGYHSVIWNGKNEFGETVSSGIYFYTIKTSTGYSKAMKMIFLK